MLYKKSFFSGFAAQISHWTGHPKTLLFAFLTIVVIPHLNEDFQDMGTSDFLKNLMENHEKRAWMFRFYF